MIVADVMQNQTMRNLAQLDYQYAVAARPTWQQSHQHHHSANSTAGANVVDVNGNPPYDVNGNVVNLMPTRWPHST